MCLPLLPVSSNNITRYYPKLYKVFHFVSDQDFQCLANWKDGSENFFYGGFTGSDNVNREDIYRCFVSITDSTLQIGSIYYVVNWFQLTYIAMGVRT